jgi:hypothetical protein
MQKWLLPVMIVHPEQEPDEGLREQAMPPVRSERAVSRHHCLAIGTIHPGAGIAGCRTAPMSSGPGVPR